MIAARYLTVILSLAAAAASASAQQQTSIPVRVVDAPLATDSGLFAAITSVRPMSDGRILVHDVALRRIVLVEANLRSHRIVADTAPGAPNRYGIRPAVVIPYLGDSSVFVDRQAEALVVIEPSGKFGRAIAVPKTSDLYFIVTYGPAQFDPQGRLVYRGYKPPPPEVSPSVSPILDVGKLVVGGSYADSAPIVRADLESRSLDTLGMMRLPTAKVLMYVAAVNNSCGLYAFNPLPTTDEWTLTSDGTVAIVRGADYHIDWWHMDGTRSSSPKMPFDWKRIDLEQREALLDSVKKAEAARREANPPTGRCVPPFVTVDAADMPDFYPPVRAGQFKSDREGNVWVLPSTSTLSSETSAGLVWDVVNPKGEIVERVKLPEGRNLAGFGPNGTVYMIYAPAPGKILLERARIIRQ